MKTHNEINLRCCQVAIAEQFFGEPVLGKCEVFISYRLHELQIHCGLCCLTTPDLFLLSSTDISQVLSSLLETPTGR